MVLTEEGERQRSDIVSLVAEEPLRLDQLLVLWRPDLREEDIRSLLAEGRILVNGKAPRSLGMHLQAGDGVTVNLVNRVLRAPSLNIPDEGSAPLPVLYEDAALLVVDKPAGVAVGRRQGVEPLSVAERVARHYPAIAHVGGVERAGVITRIDRDASGLVVIAKDEAVYRELRRALKHGRVVYTYSVLVEGKLQGEHLIDEPIGNLSHTRRRLAVTRTGRPVRTRVRSHEHYRDRGRYYTLLEVQPERARLHQIRVHLSWYGFPVVGDRIYGHRYQSMLPDRLFLHLSSALLQHPLTGEKVQLVSPLPPELASILTYMRRPKTGL